MIAYIEKKLGIHLSTYTSQGKILMLPFFVGAISTLVMSVLFAHLLPKSEYGLYKLLLSTSAIIGSLTLTGMNTAVTQAIAAGNTGIYRKSVHYQMKWNIILSIIAAIVIIFIPAIRRGLPIVVLLIIIAGTVLLTAYNTFSSYYSGTKQFVKVTISQITSTIIQTIISVIIAVTSKSGAMIVAGVFVVQSLVTYWYHRKVLRESTLSPEGDATETIRYGKKLTFINFFKILADQADKIITYIILGPVALAIYSFAYALPDQMRGFFKIIPSLSLPYLSEKSEQRIRQVLFRYLLALFIILLFFACLYAFVAPVVYKILFAPYLESIPYSKMLGFVMVPIILCLPLTSYLQARKKARLLAWSNGLQALLDIGGIVILGSKFGLWGVVYARGISASIVCLVLAAQTFLHPISAEQ